MGQAHFQGAGGIDLVADTFGDANNPTVLLLPSTGQMKEVWHATGRALAEAGRHAICVDLRGHGASAFTADGRYDLDAYGADLRAILAQLPSRAVVVGVGASGLAALLAIGEHPTPLVSALVLVGVTAWVERATLERINRAGEQRRGPFPDAAAALEAIRGMHPFEPAPTAVEKLLTAFEVGDDGAYRWRCDPRMLGAIDIPGATARVEAAARTVTAPTAIIRGSMNESVSPEATQRLRELIGGSVAFEIGGAGHHVITDHEDAFNAALLDFLERAAPRAPLRYESGSDPRVLRDALGCFGTGVTIVTTFDKAGEPVGLTANSLTSVSLDPPLILFCLAKSSANLENFTGARGFAVNVLHIGQQPASTRFTRKDGPRFEDTPWEGHRGSPLLSGSLASFDCERFAVHDGGDHLIFIGLVRYAQFEPHRDPLLFFRGKYRRLHFA